MVSPSFVDPYRDEATGVLHNKLGVHSANELDAAEADLCAVRAVQLRERPPKASSDLAELRAIHRGLFQDVYGWAGEVRTVDIRKQSAGAEPFMPVSMIERAAGFAAQELQEDRFLRGMSRDVFITRLAHHYDQWNYLHPFREGNGRAQRIFWNRIAHDAGWTLDWRSVDGATNDHACRVAAEDRDFTPMRAMFDQVVTAQ